jgi:two-component system, chemotaxis family, CheB/CheR fusion protein
MAFVLVQHLDPVRPSMLAQILGKKTAMPVAEARNDMALAPDHLYVIPPNATLTVSGPVLRVTDRDGRIPAPIDRLFRSLAAERSYAAVGVLLSGASSDGTRGAQEIKAAGGIVLAQEPDSAAFSIMPQSAISAGATDAVLRPAEIARRLASLGDLVGAGAGKSRHAAGAPAARDDEATWKRIFRLLRGASNIDFTHYKRTTLERRIARRQAVRHLDELAAYARLLDEDPAELHTLAQDVLITVTSFFRDPESFEALTQMVFPTLLERRAPDAPLRIWVPGCASGEEVYSIAICLMEHLGERAERMPIQLFGTDVSEPAIAQAREARYPEGIEAEVSPERLRRHFAKLDHHYRIAKSIRDLCVFARHDVTRDPPFSNIDLVSCRNLLIYLDGALQRQVLLQLHYALKPQGFLFLGASEAIGASADLFEMSDKRHRVFTRRTLPGHVRPAHAPREPTLTPRPAPAPAAHTREAALDTDRVQREADRMLLARYAPAAIVVDDELNVLQFRGETGRFLEHAPGPASLNLQKLAPAPLLVALVPALREARTTRAPVSRKNVRIEAPGRARKIEFEVSPFQLPDVSGSCYLVVFEEAQRPRPPALWQALLDAAARRAPAAGGAAGELEQLRRELAEAREFIQTRAEEYEATKEEMKSMHEEALSTNEEFQSTNEELETAKEELQSANEELSTTNDELRTRNQQLSALIEELHTARDFAEAIVDTSRHPLLVLNRKLQVQSANRAYYSLFQTEPGDIVGHHLYESGNGQWNIPRMHELVAKTLASNEAVVNFRVDHTFEGIGKRFLIFNTRHQVGRNADSELILIGFEDATELLAAGAALEVADHKKDEFLAMLGHELRNPLAPVISAIERMQKMEIRDEELRGYVDVLARQTDHIVRLVDDLLEMTRIASGTLALEMADMALTDAAAHAIEAARPLIEARRHRLSVQQPPEPVRVRGDRVRLTQLFTNLLTNAAKYTPPGGEIRLSIAIDGTDAVVTVADNGGGIPPLLLEHIFEPFNRHALSPTGLGIGLSIARRLAGLHGGSIAASSAGPGKGSTFAVKLPLLVHAPVAAAPAAARRKPADLRGCRVLVVDDNVDAAKILTSLLKLDGCEVRCAHDGASAVPLAERFDPDVVLLDIDLPDIDGYEVLRRLRAVPGIKPAVVSLSGYTQPADRARMAQAGFDLSLRKPITAAALAAAIASVRRQRT